MADYRVFLTDGRGKIHGAIEFVCESDEEALARAQAMIRGSPAELWQLQRMVASLNPPSSAAYSPPRPWLLLGPRIFFLITGRRRDVRSFGVKGLCPRDPVQSKGLV
jgi:hypothetical protein